MISPEEAAAEVLARRKARASIAGFAEYTQPEDQQPAAHHRVMLAALQSVIDGHNDRVMLSLPPGSAKSTYSSVIAPAYFLGANPTLNVIAASHTLVLAERFGRRARNLLADAKVEALWQTRVANDSAAAGRWSTTQGGEYLAAGVGGGITGFRADLAIIDDPVKSREEADSDLVRERHWDWYVNDLRTRLKPGGRIVLAMTRWHEDDLAGRLLEREPGRWKVLKVPMLAGENDLLGRKPGDRLWPEWYTDQMVADAQQDPRSWSALYQQEPRSAEGAEFRRSWVLRYDAPPKNSNRIILVDPASGEEGLKRTKRGNDYTSMWVVALGPDENAYVVEGVRERLNLAERVDALFDLHRRYKPVEVRYERYGMMADVQAIRMEMERRNYRFRIREVAGQVQKEARIRRLIWWFENGRIFLPQKLPYERDGRRIDLIQEFLDDEYAAFPVGKHDDMLDALSRLAEPKMPLPWPRVDDINEGSPFGVLDDTIGY